MPDPRSLLGVIMSGPRSLPGVEYVWYQVPSEDGYTMYTSLWKVHPWGIYQVRPHGRYTPWKVHLLEATSLKGTPKRCHIVVATEAGGTHPTGMLSCY